MQVKWKRGELEVYQVQCYQREVVVLKDEKSDTQCLYAAEHHFPKRAAGAKIIGGAVLGRDINQQRITYGESCLFSQFSLDPSQRQSQFGGNLKAIQYRDYERGSSYSARV